MHILCLLDSPLHDGDRWLWNYLPGVEDQVDFLVAQSIDRLGRLGKALTRYPKYLSATHQALLAAKRCQYDLIVAWESKQGLPLALLRWLRNERRTPLVILTFAAKPYLRRARAFVRPWLRCVEHMTVPSTWEAELYGREFHLQPERVSVCHLGTYDVLHHLATLGQVVSAQEDRPYIFSGGQTDRDYQTFLTSIADLRVKTIINTRQHVLTSLDVPSQVEVNDLMSPNAYFALLTGASVVVVPLHPVDHAAGLSVVMGAMAAGRPVVCTDVPVMREYVVNGITGILVPPRDPAAMCNAISRLIEKPEIREAMGRAARARYEEGFTFSAFAQRVHGILSKVAARSPNL
jgi:glycosyltransferase involved in cell wall biosynthesis